MNPIIATATGALGVLTVLLLGSVRAVPSGTCAVVTRFGRATRVATPSLVGIFPLVDRLTRVALAPQVTEWGVRVRDVVVLDIGLRTAPELLRLPR